MLENFTDKFKITDKAPQVDTLSRNAIHVLSKDVSHFLSLYEGCTFNDGIYRIHQKENIHDWNSVITESFVDFNQKIECFACDWLGRQFVNFREINSQEESSVFIFDISAGISIRTPYSFREFHESEIIKNYDTILAVKLFDEAKKNNSYLPYDKCFGCIQPVFSNGKYCIDNLKIVSTRAYWHVYGQLLRNTIN